VICEYLGETKGPKVISFKMKRRKNYRRKIGHRQIFSQLRVKEIQFQE
jgi:large subunit ribosomal protein L21